MPWQAVTLIVDARCVEALSDLLLEQGALSVDVSDAAVGTPTERPLFAEPGSAPATHWPVNRVVALFPEHAAVAQAVPSVLHASRLPTTTPYGIDLINDQDWVRLTQAQFTPQQISSRLWVVPTWHEVVDPAAINIRLDPGLAFGTGTHPTTRLCLRWLDAHLQPGQTVIDYGCGSGILAVVAKKLGAGNAVGIDIDEQAVIAARRNAEQNQVSVAFFAATDDLGAALDTNLNALADVVVANILANPLTVLAPLLARLTRQGGHVVLSGILAPQADEVREAYAPWFEMQVTQGEAEWVLLSGQKK